MRPALVNDILHPFLHHLNFKRYVALLPRRIFLCGCRMGRESY